MPSIEQFIDPKWADIKISLKRGCEVVTQVGDKKRLAVLMKAEEGGKVSVLFRGDTQPSTVFMDSILYVSKTANDVKNIVARQKGRLWA